MPENDNAFGKIIAKAWRDPAFKAALIANPAAALKAEGIDVPAGVTVTVLENTDKQFHLVLPPKPTGELSEEALEAVAGGFRQISPFALPFDVIPPYAHTINTVVAVPTNFEITPPDIIFLSKGG